MDHGSRSLLIDLLLPDSESLYVFINLHGEILKIHWIQILKDMRLHYLEISARISSLEYRDG